MDNTSPTPWAVATNGATPKVVDANGKAVCMVTPRKGQWNATLLAAAPDLLDTLRYVLLADRYDGAMTMGAARLSPAIKDRIGRAIDAATGEETTFLQPAEEIIG